MKLVLTLALLALVPAQGLAAGKTATLKKLWGPFDAALTARPDCTEVSDKCVVCAKDGENWNCSTPGIACTPETAACTKPKG